MVPVSGFFLRMKGMWWLKNMNDVSATLFIYVFVSPFLWKFSKKLLIRIQLTKCNYASLIQILWKQFTSFAVRGFFVSYSAVGLRAYDFEKSYLTNLLQLLNFWPNLSSTCSLIKKSEVGSQTWKFERGSPFPPLQKYKYKFEKKIKNFEKWTAII